MTDLNPESLAELRLLLAAGAGEIVACRCYGPCDCPDSAFDYLAAAAVNALPALLDAAGRLAEVEAGRDALAAKVERVRAMHRERPYADPELRAVAPSLPAFVCQHCWGQADVAVPHPCPTIRALDGEPA